MSGKVSVIVPIFNAARFLEKSVGSLLSQTYRDLEIILIDDGSKDESPILCKRMAQEDPRVVFIQQKKRGVSCARNRGLEVMTGDYLAFLDADDWFEPSAMENMVRRLEESGADAVFCNSYNHTESGVSLRSAQCESGPTDGRGMVRQMLCTLDDQGRASGYFFSLWNKLFRVQSLRAVPGGLHPFDPSLHILEDGVWLMEHVPHLQKGVLDPAGYHHRLIHENSVMNDSTRAEERQLAFLHGYSIILDKVAGLGDPIALNRCKEAYLKAMDRMEQLVYDSEEKNPEPLTKMIQDLNVAYGPELLAGKLLDAYAAKRSPALYEGEKALAIAERSFLARLLYKGASFIAFPKEGLRKLRLKLWRFGRRWLQRIYWAVRNPLSRLYHAVKGDRKE